MDFASFDRRGYPTLGVADGYSEWAKTYDATVLDLMDLALFERLERPYWSDDARVIDLACGTGRIGTWLISKGVRKIDGIDLTPEMLERAKATGVYDNVLCGDIAETYLPGSSYDIATMSLADEHLTTLEPVYAEAARLLVAKGSFVIVGYHSHFLMTAGMPTHYENGAGESVAVKSHVHLMSDHVAAAKAADFDLTEMTEGVIDDAWISAKPKWAQYKNHPISFAFVWKKK
jgi:SAM-dependent methyltransferase